MPTFNLQPFPGFHLFGAKASTWWRPAFLKRRAIGMPGDLLKLGDFLHRIRDPWEISLSQWQNFKLSGITCLVGKIKFKLLAALAQSLAAQGGGRPQGLAAPSGWGVSRPKILEGIDIDPSSKD